jgi:hypothetical protein
VQHADQQDAHRLGQVDHRGEPGVGQDRLRLARVALDRDHPVPGGQQRLRM